MAQTGANGTGLSVVVDNADSLDWLVTSVPIGRSFCLRFRGEDSHINPGDLDRLITLHEAFEAGSRTLSVIYCADVTDSPAVTQKANIDYVVAGGVNLIAIEAGNETYSGSQANFNFSVYKDGNGGSIIGFAGLFALVQVSYPNIPFSIFLAPRPLRYPDNSLVGILAGDATDANFNNAVINFINTDDQLYPSIHFYLSFETQQVLVPIDPVIYNPAAYYPDLDNWYSTLWGQTITNLTAVTNNYWEKMLLYLETVLPDKLPFISEFGYDDFNSFRNAIGTGMFDWEIWNRYGRDPRINALCIHSLAGMINEVSNKDLNPNGYANLQRLDYLAFKMYRSTDALSVNALPSDLILNSPPGDYYYWYVNFNNIFTRSIGNLVTQDGSSLTGSEIYSTSGKTQWMSAGTTQNYEVSDIEENNGLTPNISFGFVHFLINTPNSQSNMATPVFTVNFNLDSDSATFGNFILTDTTDYPAEGLSDANMRGYWKITDPLGVYRTGSFTTPDTNGATDSWVYDDLAIRTLTSVPVGYLLGGYVFDYFVKDIVSGTIYTTSTSYTFSPPVTVVDADGVVQDACLSYTIDCFCTILKLTDITELGTPTTTTRTLELSPPSFLELVDVETNNTTLSYTFSYVNVAYSVELILLLTYVTDNVTVTVRLTYRNAITVKCLQSVPKLYACFIKFNTYFRAQASKYGGESNIKSELFSDFIAVLSYFQQIEAQIKIGQTASAETTFDKISEIMNMYVECDCHCANTDQPELIDPYCGGGGSGSGGDMSFVATYPVVVVVAGTVVTYSLAPAFLAAFAALENTTVASSDTSVTVTGGPDYNLAIKQWITLQANFFYDAGVNMSVLISNLSKQGNRYVSAFATGDIQAVGYPFGSLPLLQAAQAKFYVKNFLSTAAVGDVPDKMTFSTRIDLALASGDADTSYPDKFRLVHYDTDDDGFYFRVVYADSGLPVSFGVLNSEADETILTIKINQ